ncbi:MAG: amidohydrolase family protein, partial [Dehalococcoidia bacterium]
MAIDLLIRNVAVIDGSGAPAYAANVGVSGDRIASVGKGEPSATRELDGTGLTLAPGFVDVHSHDDTAFIRHPGMEFKLSQGVTSEISGNCGMSAAPFDPSVPRRAGDLVPGSADWTDLEGFFRVCEARRPAINNAMLVGHNSVRHLVAPNERRRATPDEVRRMRGLVRQSMEQGAVGFSTGLIYEPGRYSDTDEVVALAAECTSFGGVYATHMRNEGDGLLDAAREAMEIARRADIPLHISHHKAAGKANWGKVAESLAAIDAANAIGADITLDVYPYTAGSGPMNQYVDLANINVEWAANVLIATCPDFREFEGRMIPAIAEEQGWSIEEAVRQVLTGPHGKETLCIHFIIDEKDI